MKWLYPVPNRRASAMYKHLVIWCSGMPVNFQLRKAAGVGGSTLSLLRCLVTEALENLKGRWNCVIGTGLHVAGGRPWQGQGLKASVRVAHQARGKEVNAWGRQPQTPTTVGKERGSFLFLSKIISALCNYLLCFVFVSVPSSVISLMWLLSSQPVSSFLNALFRISHSSCSLWHETNTRLKIITTWYS